MKTITIISFAFIVLMQTTLFAQWQNIGSGKISGAKQVLSISSPKEDVLWAVAFSLSNPLDFEFTRTVNGGALWDTVSWQDTSNSYYPLNVTAINKDIAWVVMVNYPAQDRSIIVKTIDGGQNWINQPGLFNSAGHAFASMHFFNSNEGLCFGSPGTSNPAIDSLQIYRTADGGQSWNRIPASSLPTPLQGEGVWIYSGNNSYESKGDTLWFLSRAGRVFRTTDKGLTWNAYTVGNASQDEVSVAFQSSTTGIVIKNAPVSAYKTVDGGETWSSISIPSVINKFGAIEYVPGTNSTYVVHAAAFGSNSSTLLITNDGGSTWNSGTYQPHVACLQFLSPSIGYAGGVTNQTAQTGLYKWIGKAVGIEEYINDKASIIISPNPSNTQMYIDIEDGYFEDNIMVEIMNVQGDIVFAFKAQNSKRIKINTEALASGIYVVRVYDGLRSVTRKMIKN